MNEETNYTLINDLILEYPEFFINIYDKENQRFPVIENESVIYAIVNRENNKKYIGSAMNMRRRINMHVNHLKKSIHHSTALQNACNKYGIEIFKFIILEKVPERENLVPREQYWIDTLKPEYNISPTAGSSLGIKRSDETIRKLSERHMGVKHSEERRRQKSLYQKGVKRKNPVSEQTKLNQSLAQKKLYASGYKNPQSKTVYKYSVDGVYLTSFESVVKAAYAMQVCSSAITACAKGRSKVCAGFRWSYIYYDKLEPLVFGRGWSNYVERSENMVFKNINKDDR